MFPEQLLATDDIMYRAAQAITVIHAHRTQARWLRVIALADPQATGRAPAFVAAQGERLQRPAASIGLNTDLGHTQHLHTRCVSPLGSDPVTLRALIGGGHAHELESHGLVDRVTTATWGLAGALDEQQRERNRPAKSFRLWRAPTPHAAREAQERVDAWTEQLRAALRDLNFVPLSDLGLSWDEVTEEPLDMPASA
ncbi:hypothetical protein [Deinococcus depolymerans]